MKNKRALNWTRHTHNGTAHTLRVLRRGMRAIQDTDYFESDGVWMRVGCHNFLGPHDKIIVVRNGICEAHIYWYPCEKVAVKSTMWPQPGDILEKVPGGFYEAPKNIATWAREIAEEAS